MQLYLSVHIELTIKTIMTLYSHITMKELYREGGEVGEGNQLIRSIDFPSPLLGGIGGPVFR